MEAHFYFWSYISNVKSLNVISNLSWSVVSANGSTTVWTSVDYVFATSTTEGKQANATKSKPETEIIKIFQH